MQITALAKTILHGKNARRLGCAGTKPVHIGYFEEEEEAARSYDVEAIKLRGPNTTLNYPASDYGVCVAPPY